MAEVAPARTDERVVLTVTPEKIYAELRASIRETDAISFKLLGLVPLVSGAALVGLVKTAFPLPAAMVVSFFAAGITLGLFRWELRNVQTCSWLIRYVAALETKALASSGVALDPELQRRPEAPRFFGKPFGKSEAEKIIYPVTILAWLALPASRYSEAAANHGLFAYYIYIAPALVLLVAAAVSIFAELHVERRRTDSH
jgi:hypothetical protein